MSEHDKPETGSEIHPSTRSEPSSTLIIASEERAIEAMTVMQIIEALTPFTGRFPEAAVRAAIEQKDAITPHLLQVLEEIANAPESFAGRHDYMLPLFATHLLAQFREKRAYRLLCRILAAQGTTADDLFGDTIADGLDRLLASVYDGDSEPIKRLVENDSIDIFVRGSAIETFTILFHTGQMPRDEVVNYFRGLFQGKLERDVEVVWDVLATAVGKIPAPELIPEMRLASEDERLDPMCCAFEELERDALTPFEQKSERVRNGQSLVRDAVSEMEWWAAFQRDEADDENDEDDEEDFDPRSLFDTPTAHGGLENDYPASVPSYAPPQYSPPPPPFVRPTPKIGRNDPCPCGSGKKYKKCCLD